DQSRRRSRRGARERLRLPPQNHQNLGSQLMRPRARRVAAPGPTPSKGNAVKIKKSIAVAAALGIALSGVALAAPANADPVSNSYVLAGSDTLQDVVNALTTGTSVTGSLVRVVASNTTIASYDAFGSNAIQTKPDGPFFGR